MAQAWFVTRYARVWYDIVQQLAADAEPIEMAMAAYQIGSAT